MTFRNFESTIAINSGSLILLASSEEIFGNTFVSINDVHLENLMINQGSLFYSYGVQIWTNITNGYYNNISIPFGASIYEFSNIKSLNVLTNVIENTKSLDSTDDSATFLSISQMDPEGLGEASFSGFTCSNSQISVIKLYGVIGKPSTLKEFIISDIHYSSSYFLQPQSLISFEGLVTESDFRITIQDSTFSDLEYSSKGAALNFQHQMVNSVMVRNTSFENIINGYIEISTFSAEFPNLQTMVDIADCSFTNILTLSESILEVSRGAQLSISSSTFSSLTSLSDTSGVIN